MLIFLTLYFWSELDYLLIERWTDSFWCHLSNWDWLDGSMLRSQRMNVIFLPCISWCSPISLSLMLRWLYWRFLSTAIPFLQRLPPVIDFFQRMIGLHSPTIFFVLVCECFGRVSKGAVGRSLYQWYSWRLYHFTFGDNLIN